MNQFKQAGQVQSLKIKELRAIERALHVFLVEPKSPDRTPNQQFDVLNAHEERIDKIVADQLFFGADELNEKIKLLILKHT